jgi:hypothetical protein
MFGYATSLRSDPGSGDLQHGIRQYNEVPGSIAEAVTKKH